MSVLLKATNDDWIGGYKYFTEKEMACRCGCGGLPKHSFMVRLDKIREAVGKPLVVASGFRCSTYDSKIGGAGVHPMGIAVDIRTFGTQAYELIEMAQGFGVTGIGVKQHGLHPQRFIHLDTVQGSSSYPRPWIWSYK